MHASDENISMQKLESSDSGHLQVFTFSLGVAYKCSTSLLYTYAYELILSMFHRVALAWEKTSA
jgi:hypothetical protein